jgi:hypothetical protein
MPLVDFGHVHPVNDIVILDCDRNLSSFGKLPGVLLRGIVAIQLTDLYLYVAG